MWAQEQGETSPTAECPLAAAALSPGLGTSQQDWLFTTSCERSSAPSFKTVTGGKEQGLYWYQPFFSLSFLPGSYSLRLQGCTPLLTGQGGPSKGTDLMASSNRVLVKALPPATHLQAAYSV